MLANPVKLEFVREVDFAPIIVFDALVDPDLLGGWLADAHVEPWVGGIFNLVWLTSSSFPPTHGMITALVAHHLLEVATDNRGLLRFELEEARGGSRGTKTIVTIVVTVEVDSAFLPRVAADWQGSLDQLEALLHGRPVDWANWDRDRSAAWREYLATAGGH